MEITSYFEKEGGGKKVHYSLRHKTIPIQMSDSAKDAIFYLLRYVPNINSAQSRDNELISNIHYDSYTFIEIMKYMKLFDKDVLFCEEIPEDLVDYYTGSISTSCQKLVLTQSSGETKTESLLRHIRNSIAHGNFTIVDDLFVGFDFKNINKYEKKCTAFYKIDPENLLNALKSLDKNITSMRLVSIALERCGYEVEPYQEEYQKSNRFDLYAKKDERRYAIEIIDYATSDMIDHKDVLRLIKAFEGSLEKLKVVLIINTSFLSDYSKEVLLKHEIIILDIKNIKKLLQGRDMILEIEESS